MDFERVCIPPNSQESPITSNGGGPGEAGTCGVVDPEAARTELQASLAKIFGLAEVKRAASELIDQAVVEELMRQHAPSGMQGARGRQNFAFLGPPGTGKTTIAKLLSDAFCKLGRVKNRTFLEVRPDELIGEYLGQTQKAVKERLEPGLGGVIFIDEAYLITAGEEGRGPNQYQQEAVGVLMKLLDERADDTVFIFAGYVKDMEDFFKSNDGLKRRIPRIFRFDPFAVDDILSIMDLKTRLKGVGLIPQLSQSELDLMVDEFGSIANSQKYGFLPEPGTANVAKGFVNYVKSRVGLVYHLDTSLHQSNQDINEGKITMQFKEWTPYYEEAFLQKEVRALLEEIPEGMRTNMNGGLVDTLLTGASRARASRILRDKLLTQEGCMPEGQALRRNSNNVQEMFAHACPPVLFYSLDDLRKAQEEAVGSWGENTDSKDTVDLILKALRPAAHRWQEYGRWMADHASDLSTADPDVARFVMPLFAEADRAMKVADRMLRNSCEQQSCAAIGYPPLEEERLRFMKDALEGTGMPLWCSTHPDGLGCGKLIDLDALDD